MQLDLPRTPARYLTIPARAIHVACITVLLCLSLQGVEHRSTRLLASHGRPEVLQRRQDVLGLFIEPEHGVFDEVQPRTDPTHIFGHCSLVFVKPLEVPAPRRRVHVKPHALGSRMGVLGE